MLFKLEEDSSDNQEQQVDQTDALDEEVPQEDHAVVDTPTEVKPNKTRSISATDFRSEKKNPLPMPFAFSYQTGLNWEMKSQVEEKMANVMGKSKKNSFQAK